MGSTTRRRVWQEKLTGLVVACLASAVLLQPTGVLAQSCGVASLFDFCVLVGQELSEGQREEIVEAYPVEEATMLDIKQVAESLGIAVVGRPRGH
jgi:hypothetical protein